MHFLFSAPFRTGINLNTLHALNNAYETEMLFCRFKDHYAARESHGFELVSVWGQKIGGELKYASLEEDFDLPIAQPLVEVAVDMDFDRICEGLPGGGACRVTDCKIRFYDNTIGILVWRVDIEDIISYQMILSHVDEWSSKVSSTIIRASKELEDVILRFLVSDSKASALGLTIKSGGFEVFADRNGKCHEESMLWVTRVVFVHDTNIDSLKSWARNELNESDMLQFGAFRGALCVGNSVILGKGDLEECVKPLIKSLCICTYFYVLHDVVNGNLRNIFLKVSSEPSQRISVYSKIRRTQDYISYVGNEFRDVKMGLQGYSKIAAERFLHVWGYDELVDAVNYKNGSVSRVVEAALEEKNRRYERIVESLLALIGGVAFLDFALNIIAASRGDIADDGVFGLIDIVGLISPDSLLYAIIFFLLLVFLLMLRKR